MLGCLAPGADHHQRVEFLDHNWGGKRGEGRDCDKQREGKIGRRGKEGQEERK